MIISLQLLQMDSSHPSNDFSELIPITAQEEKELLRVHDMLCDYLPKSRLEKELQKLEQANDGIQQLLISDSEQYTGSSSKLASSQLNNSLVVLNKNEERIDEIKAELERFKNNPNKKISLNDLQEALKALNQKLSKQELEEMIWECDEDLDNCLNWNEFKLMYCRNNTDRTGLEPSRMVSYYSLFFIFICNYFH